MKCPKCGKKIEAKGKFCPYCGNQINDLEKDNTNSETSKNQKSDLNGNNKTLRLAIIAFCVSLILCCISIGAWIIATANNGKKNQPMVSQSDTIDNSNDSILKDAGSEENTAGDYSERKETQNFVRKKIDIDADVTPEKVNLWENPDDKPETFGELKATYRRSNIGNYEVINDYPGGMSRIELSIQPRIDGDSNMVFYNDGKELFKHDFPYFAANSSYGAIIDLNSDEFSDIRVFHLYVEYNGQRSNTLHFYKFKNLSKENKKEVMDIIGSFDDLVSDLIVEGYMPEENVKTALERIEKAALELKEKDKSIIVNNSGTSLYVMFANGIEYVYQPKIKGRSEGGGGIDVATIEPYEDLQDPNGDGSQYNTMVDGLGSLIAETFEEASYKYNVDEDDVTLNYISNNLRQNQVILWYGHGGWNEETGSFLVIGHSYTEDDFTEENLAKGILFMNDDRIAFSKYYIDSHFPDYGFKNSMLFIHACYSAKEDLAYLFHKKGASAVVGFSDSVKTAYANDIMEYTIKKMCTINDETGDYYTIGDALSYALGFCGIDDSEYSGDGTFPVLIGDPDYTISSAIEKIEKSPFPDGRYHTAIGEQSTKDTFDFYDFLVGNLHDAAVNVKDGNITVIGGFVDQNHSIYSYDTYNIPLDAHCIYRAGVGSSETGYIDLTPDDFNRLYHSPDKEYLRKIYTGFGFTLTIENGVVVDITEWGE